MQKEKEVHNNEIHVRFIPPKNWRHRAKWELLKDYTSHNGAVVVPAGFITDGATIPWFLRWMFSPTGKYFGAAIVHDCALESNEGWEKSNLEFDCELRALRVGKWRRKMMLAGVTAYPKAKKFFTGTDEPDRNS